MGSVSGLGRSFGEGNGNLLQYSCLGNPMDRGAWWLPQSVGLQRVRHGLLTKTIKNKMYFIGQIVTYFGKCSVLVWEECTMLLLDDIFYIFQLNQLIDGVSKFSYILLVFHWLNWYIHEKGMLKSLIIIVYLSIFLYSFISFCIIYFEAVFKCININNYLVFLVGWPFYHYTMPLFISDNFLCSEVCLVWN